jgi:hypothetical protein
MKKTNSRQHSKAGIVLRMGYRPSFRLVGTHFDDDPGFTINECTPTPSSTQQTPGVFLFPFLKKLYKFLVNFPPKNREINQIYSAKTYYSSNFCPIFLLEK